MIWPAGFGRTITAGFLLMPIIAYPAVVLVAALIIALKLTLITTSPVMAGRKMSAGFVLALLVWGHRPAAVV